MLGWGWPLFANSSGGEGGTVAAATPQTRWQSKCDFAA
jgi:hypothetical protein